MYGLLDGLSANFLITILAFIFPMLLGTLISVLIRKSVSAQKVFKWINAPFASISIPIFFTLLYYFPGLVFGSRMPSRILPCIIALSFAHLFYIPARYDNGYTFLKNILNNALGLLSSLFLWSITTRIISINDIFFKATEFVATRGNILPLIFALLITLSISCMLKIGQLLIKQFMK